MVDLVLDDLGRPAGEGLEAGLELLVLVLHFDGLPTLGLSGTGEGQTALLRFIGLRLPDDLRVKHDHVLAFVVEGNEALVDSDHVGRHAHTAVLVGGQGVQ